MKEDKFSKKLYDQICKFLSVKSISWIAFILFVVLLLPICYLSFVNRASGDDYGYGAYTRAAWMASHSLVEVAKAIGVTIRQYYVGWQGTWFSIAVFALQPEVFHDKAYVIVVFLMLTLWIGSTALLFWQIFKIEIGLDKWNYFLILTVYLIISIQFIPSTKSSIFWFNGCAHYMLPYAMCQIVTWCLLRYVKKYRFRYLIGISFLMFLLGGSNYQAALFALIVLAYIGTVNFVKHRNKRIFQLLIPLILEMAGLIISMKAPGNKVRGGEEFGFSITKVVVTIGKCFVEGGTTAINYIRTKPVVIIGFIILFFIFVEGNKSKRNKKNLEHPIIVILALICLFCAMQAPEIYAGVEVSSGVHNMNYLVFLLAAAGGLWVIAAGIADKIEMDRDVIHRCIVIPGLFLCSVLLFLVRSDLKGSTSWISYEYIRSGQAADYKEQMDLQTEILTDENIRDAVVPFINDVQGPLMSMPATADSNAWTNTVMAEFYGKNSVIAMPRDKWEEKQGRR